MKKIILCCISTGLYVCSYAQFNSSAPSPNRFGQTDKNGGSNNWIRSIAIGNFTSNSLVPRANLHVNSFGLLPQSPDYANGNLFRTDGNQTSVNQWQLYTGPTQILLPKNSGCLCRPVR